MVSIFRWNPHQLLFLIWILSRSQPSEGSFLNAALGLRIGLSPNEKGLDPSTGGVKGQFITGVQGKAKSGGGSGWSKGDNGFIRHLKILGVNLYLGKQKYPQKNGGGWKPTETSGHPPMYTIGHLDGKEGVQHSHYYGHTVHEGGPSTGPSSSGYASNKVNAVHRPEEKLVVYLPAASQYPKFSTEGGSSVGGPTYHVIPTVQTYPSQGQPKQNPSSRPAPSTTGQGFSLASLMKGPQWVSNLKSRLRFNLYPSRGPPPPLLMRTLNSVHSPSEKSPRGSYSTLFPAKLVGEPSSHPQFIHGRPFSTAESRHPRYTYFTGGQVAHSPSKGEHQNMKHSMPTYMPKYVSHFAHPPSTMPVYFSNSNNPAPQRHTLGSPYSSGSQGAPKFQGSSPIVPNPQVQSFSNSQGHFYNMIAGESPMTYTSSSPVSFSPPKFMNTQQLPPSNFYSPTKESSFPLDFPPPSFKPGNEIRNSFTESKGEGPSHSPGSYTHGLGDPSGRIQGSARPYLGTETENYFASEAQRQHSSRGQPHKPSSSLMEFTPADTVQTYHDFGVPGSHFASSQSQFESSRPSFHVESHPQSFNFPPPSKFQAQSGSEQQQFTQQQFPSTDLQQQFPSNVQHFSSNSQEFPSNSQQFPSNSQEFPSNSQQFPSNSQQFPSTSQQFPSNSQQFPSNSQQFTSNSQQFPSNSQQFPSNSQQFPSNSQQFPTNTQPEFTQEASTNKGQTGNGPAQSGEPQYQALSQPQFGGQGYMEMFNPDTMQESMPYQLPDGFQYSHTVSSPIVSMGSSTRDDPPIMMDMGGDQQPAEYPSFSTPSQAVGQAGSDGKRGSSLNTRSAPSTGLTRAASFPSLTQSKGHETPRTLKKRKSSSSSKASKAESMVTAASTVEKFNHQSSLNSWVPLPPHFPPSDLVTNKSKGSMLAKSIAQAGILGSDLNNKNETNSSSFGEKRFFIRRRTTPTTSPSTTTSLTTLASP